MLRPIEKKNEKQKRITKLKDLYILLPVMREMAQTFIGDLDSEEKVARIPSTSGETVRFKRYKEVEKK